LPILGKKVGQSVNASLFALSSLLLALCSLLFAPQSAIDSVLQPFTGHPLTHIAIIVHVHEQVLPPFSSRLCIVTKHHAFELHSQRSL